MFLKATVLTVMISSLIACGSSKKAQPAPAAPAHAEIQSESESLQSSVPEAIVEETKPVKKKQTKSAKKSSKPKHRTYEK
jgi:hypothetical protein